MIGIILIHFFILAPIFLYLFSTKEDLKKSYQSFLDSKKDLGVMILVFFLIMVEVHFLDRLIHYDLTSLFSYEFPFWMWFKDHTSILWHSTVLYPLVYTYLVLHTFLLYFAPFLVLVSDRQTFRLLSRSMMVIFLIALPFYLFFPITNVYTFFNIPSSMERIIPGVESQYYLFTTTNNCFPSLHVGIPFLYTLVVLRSKRKNMKRLGKFMIFYSVLISFSVIFLAIHWITDAIGGLLVGWLAYKITLKIFHRELTTDGGSL